MGVIYQGGIPLGVGVGGVSAYEAAIAAGYTGTAEEFAVRMASSPTTVTFTATIDTTWTGASAPFTQEIAIQSVNGYTVLEADNPLVDVVLPADPTESDDILTAWSTIDKIETVDGGIIVSCAGPKTTTAIPIQIKVVRVNSFQSVLTRDNLVEAVKDYYYDTILTAAGWVGASAPYTQSVNIAEISSTIRPVIDVILSSNTEASDAILEAWANVSRIYTVDGGIVAECYKNKPETDIPIQLKVV